MADIVKEDLCDVAASSTAQGGYMEQDEKEDSENLETVSSVDQEETAEVKIAIQVCTLPSSPDKTVIMTNKDGIADTISPVLQENLPSNEIVLPKTLISLEYVTENICDQQTAISTSHCFQNSSEAATSEVYPATNRTDSQKIETCDIETVSSGAQTPTDECFQNFSEAVTSEIFPAMNRTDNWKIEAGDLDTVSSGAQTPTDQCFHTASKDVTSEMLPSIRTDEEKIETGDSETISFGAQTPTDQAAIDSISSDILPSTLNVPTGCRSENVHNPAIISLASKENEPKLEDKSSCELPYPANSSVLMQNTDLNKLDAFPTDYIDGQSESYQVSFKNPSYPMKDTALEENNNIVLQAISQQSQELQSTVEDSLSSKLEENVNIPETTTSLDHINQANVASEQVAKSSSEDSENNSCELKSLGVLGLPLQHNDVNVLQNNAAIDSPDNCSSNCQFHETSLALSPHHKVLTSEKADEAQIMPETTAIRNVSFESSSSSTSLDVEYIEDKNANDQVCKVDANENNLDETSLPPPIPQQVDVLKNNIKTEILADWACDKNVLEVPISESFIEKSYDSKEGTNAENSDDIDNSRNFAEKSMPSEGSFSQPNALTYPLKSNEAQSNNSPEGASLKTDNLSSSPLDQLFEGPVGYGEDIDDFDHISQPSLTVFECNVCFTIAGYTKESFTRHQRNHHMTHLQCKVCIRKFPTITAYENHMITHIRYPCLHCPQEFQHPWEVEEHQSQHFSNKLFRCDKCDEEFYLKATLKHHQLFKGEKCPEIQKDVNKIKEQLASTQAEELVKCHSGCSIVTSKRQMEEHIKYHERKDLETFAKERGKAKRVKLESDV